MECAQEDLESPCPIGRVIYFDMGLIWVHYSMNPLLNLSECICIDQMQLL